ncbi:MAG TPA: hypothetical protein VEF53_06060 [Patescibacteria group bacterium]|nr:hypothetical protein [Patescibacteria group bacterium]
MNNNKELKKYLNVEKLIFIASEFIIHESKDKDPRKRIDVIAFDGIDTVIFFEMKTPQNEEDDPLSQVSEYIERYGKNGKYGVEAKQILMEYPINGVTTANYKIKGYAVYGYGEKINQLKSTQDTIYFA